MKILFVVTKANFGGAQKYVFDLATNLDESVAVAAGPAPHGPDALFEKLRDEPVTCIRLESLGRDVGFADWRAFSDLVGLMKAERPDVVHLNSSKAGGLGALAARIAGVPMIIFTVHGIPYHEPRSLLSRIAIRLATYATILLSHTTITVARHEYEELRRFSSRIICIPLGLHTPSFLTREEARAKLALPPAHRHIGMIAELTPNKGISLALRTLQLLPTFHLTIIGDGDRAAYDEEARSLGISDRVRFGGFLPDAASLLKAFDVYLMTSVKEGLPFALLEAALAGIPIVAADLPGVREALGNALPHDASQLAEALRTAVPDPTLARRVREKYGFERMLNDTKALYRRAAATTSVVSST